MDESAARVRLRLGAGRRRSRAGSRRDQATGAVRRRRRPAGRQHRGRDRQPPGPVDGRAGRRLAAGARLVAVDPFDATWRYGGRDTRHLLGPTWPQPASPTGSRCVPTTSRAARAAYDGQVDLLYVDGKHDYWTVRDDLRWADRVPAGGTVLVHDAFSSFGVTLALLRSAAGLLRPRVRRPYRLAGLSPQGRPPPG